MHMHSVLRQSIATVFVLGLLLTPAQPLSNGATIDSIVPPASLEHQLGSAGLSSPGLFEAAWPAGGQFALSSADNTDSDGDRLSDSFELSRAQRWAPYLIFDEHENKSLINTMLTLFQVTPKGGQIINSIVITYVFLYEDDPGADIGGCYYAVDILWAELNLFAVFPQVTQADVKAIKSGHCGDTETLKIYLNADLQPQSIRITRHSQSKTYTWSELSFSGLHPKIWVSQNKHGMYISGNECETKGSKKVPKLGCTISWEDCSGGKEFIPPITDAQNVGEKNGHSRYSTVKQTGAKNADAYPGEYIWDTSGTTLDESFCGGYKASSCSEGCAGSLKSKWESK